MLHYAVVGGGPCGIFSALLLARAGNRVTLFERNGVLGGCHRVDRAQGRFSEHGPRIYMTNYFCYAQLLRLCGVDFDCLYVPYKYPFLVGLAGVMQEFTVAELLRLSGMYLLFVIDPDRFKRVSVEESFAGYSERALRYVHKICTLTDGAKPDNYTTYGFLSLFDQNALYEIVQPVQANDRALWPRVEETLRQHGVAIRHAAVERVLECEGRASGVATRDGTYAADAVVVSLPPAHAAPLFSNSVDVIANAFMPRDAWPAFVRSNTYINYISFTVHFDREVPLPQIWGNGFGAWGVAWIVMSDYFGESESPTLISALIGERETPSAHTGLTADQTTDADALMREAYRQMAQQLRIESPPAAFVLSTGVYYDSAAAEWRTTDMPVMHTPHSEPVSAFGGVGNLYWVGPHNFNHRYAFTSMESVCENVVAFCGALHPEVRALARRRRLLALSDIIRAVTVLLVLALVLRSLSRVWAHQRARGT